MNMLSLINIRWIKRWFVVWLQRSARFIALLSASSTLMACASYLDDGSLVRHHFGYVKVITPAVHAPDVPVQALEVETFGIWVGIDGRDRGLTDTATGFGIGYRLDERLLVPADCRSVIRVTTQNQLNQLLSVLQNVPEGGVGVCVVQDP